MKVRVVYRGNGTVITYPFLVTIHPGDSLENPLSQAWHQSHSTTPPMGEEVEVDLDPDYVPRALAVSSLQMTQGVHPELRLDDVHSHVDHAWHCTKICPTCGDPMFTDGTQDWLVRVIAGILQERHHQHC